MDKYKKLHNCNSTHVFKYDDNGKLQTAYCNCGMPGVKSITYDEYGKPKRVYFNDPEIKSALWLTDNIIELHSVVDGFDITRIYKNDVIDYEYYDYYKGRTHEISYHADGTIKHLSIDDSWIIYDKYGEPVRTNIL